MLDAKAAAQVAMDYFTELVGRGPVNVALEEVEWSEPERHWYITLGYNESAAIGLGQRKFKVLKIEAETGRVVSMKMRVVD